ncbi:MAG: hypothetical protein HY688_04480 [Chloroflexi bacterium]|nr:hypothetical protein [Chloroflexota bacterium]
MAHEPPHPSNPITDRLLLPLVLPLAAAGVTAGLIVAIGSLLLSFGGQHLGIGALKVSTPVVVALLLALAVLLLGAALAATWGRARR